ncbi:UNVERIFIED_CONTAM: Retrovirus-related Pol polyprotein from transposon RE1 [Sesamum radiatum]|uniref:Retrovirus-related Pol polyprotein from transposon RE1 n=1 Tax=Sesamum radiatum TaxID=300843 RepID=A0AAW2JE90_SESRA
MRYKSEAFGRFKEYRLEVENQTNCKIKALRSNRGGEQLSGEFIDYLKENGILSQWTPPGTPQPNGVAERRNRTFLDMVRSMMSFTKLPPSFWGYAHETAAKLLNMAPSKSVSQTPYEIWHGKPASYKYLRVWGSPEARTRVLMKSYGISGSSVAYLVLYVDDILLIGNDVKMLGDIKTWLSTQFSVKDMGEASYILGIKIYRDRSRRMLGLTQSSYIEKVLKRFMMEHSK